MKNVLGVISALALAVGIGGAQSAQAEDDSGLSRFGWKGKGEHHNKSEHKMTERSGKKQASEGKHLAMTSEKKSDQVECASEKKKVCTYRAVPAKCHRAETFDDDSGLSRFGWYKSKKRSKAHQASPAPAQISSSEIGRGGHDYDDDSGLSRFSAGKG